jgi:rod shape-determining protein MreC
MLLIWFTLAGFILLFSPQNLTNKFQFAFFRLFHWPLRIGRSISLSTGTQQPVGDEGLVSRKKYKQLQNYLDNVEQQRDDEHKKVEQLSKMRNIPAWERMGFVPSDVTTVSIDEIRSELIINRGADDGLVKGQFVLYDNSIIGTISDVDGRSAKVRLFTDPSSRMAVRIGDSDLSPLLMQGSGGNLARISMAKHEAKVGSEVMAGKKAGFLDIPMIIGKVVRCEHNAEPLLWDITVEPVSNIQKVESIHVIIMNPPN